ncbi:MAG TPA: transposase [Rariglobus sp.]
MFWGADEEEFCAYVTNLDEQHASPAQVVLTYRKRADAENVFDELKNQRGFDGFCSGKGVVSETAARLLLPTCNLWSLFVRVIKEEDCHREAITSRDELLVMPAKLVESGCQKTLKLSVGEKWWNAISRAHQRLKRWLASIAPQLQPRQTFERYLCWINPASPDDWLPHPSP